jgi:integrase
MSEIQALDKTEILSVLKIPAAESKRNHAMILLAFKHRLRAPEICSLKLSKVDLKNGIITIKRRKGSKMSVQDMLDIPGQPHAQREKSLEMLAKLFVIPAL